MSVGRQVEKQSIFFSPDIVYENTVLLMNNIMGWYFVSIKPQKEAPKKTFMSSMSGMFSSKPPSGTTLYHGTESYYLFEKDESHNGENDLKKAGFRHVEIPISQIDLDNIVATEDQRKIQTGGLRKKSRKTKTSKKSKKSKKTKKSRRHH